MTIGAWVGVIVGAILGFGIAGAFLYIYFEDKEKPFLYAGAVIAIATAIFCGLFIWYRSTSESGKRALKDQRSNLSGGIERAVSVYDISGNLIEQYSGKFDIETDRTSYIMFDDEQGKRHIIYYTTGTIIVDEK